ncbi:hypothetical protein JB92DRAFT_2835272 [Gautieria morchelliformis]|nr:hypothetical protein JB92DRAFT_2835272 [Gautieria morchelliformis]
MATDSQSAMLLVVSVFVRSCLDFEVANDKLKGFSHTDTGHRLSFPQPPPQKPPGNNNPIENSRDLRPLWNLKENIPPSDIPPDIPSQDDRALQSGSTSRDSDLELHAPSFSTAALTEDPSPTGPGDVHSVMEHVNNVGGRAGYVDVHPLTTEAYVYFWTDGSTSQAPQETMELDPELDVASLMDRQSSLRSFTPADFLVAEPSCAPQVPPSYTPIRDEYWQAQDAQDVLPQAEEEVTAVQEPLTGSFGNMEELVISHIAIPYHREANVLTEESSGMIDYFRMPSPLELTVNDMLETHVPGPAPDPYQEPPPSSR